VNVADEKALLLEEVATQQPIIRHFAANRSTSNLCCEWRVRNPKASFVLIFLPGIDADVHHNVSFAKLAIQFKEQIVVGVEYPGHGRSTGARGELPPSRDFLEDVVDCLDWIVSEESGKSFVLCGNSLGGLLALLAAEILKNSTRSQHSHKLLGVVALAPAIDTLVDGSFESCHCRGCGSRSRHCCSLVSPCWCVILEALRCLVVQCGCKMLLPKEGGDKYEAMPAAERESYARSMVVDRMQASGVLSLLGLMKILQRSHWGVTGRRVPLLLVSGDQDWAIPRQSVSAFAAARGLNPWPSNVVELQPGQSYLMRIAGGEHHLLMGGKRWDEGGDLAQQVVLPAISAWLRWQEAAALEGA
jgi:pimeloyl-ACP methyl ester carboxylesterase